MNIRNVIRALRNTADPLPARGEDCLPSATLAGYLDRELGEGERAVAEAHLADCDYCLGQVAALSRSREDRQSAGVPASIREAAERLAGGPPQSRPAVPRWAMAAVVVLAVGLFGVLLAPRGGPEPDPGERQTRYAEQPSLQPTLLAPPEGSVIRPLEQVFRWSEVPGSLFYDVRLVSPDGDLLLRERVEDTRWLIPEAVALQPGEEYYVRIDAYLSDAKYLSSEHVVFTVSRGD